MKKAITIFLVSLFLLQSISAENVITLTSENFDQVIAESPLILVEFYAPWCGHCKRLAPEYEAAATDLKGEIPLAAVDTDAEPNRPLGGKYRIQGFPTLKVFRNGVPSDYTGGRTREEIVSFMRKQALPAVSELSTIEDVTSFSTKDKVVAVGFFAPNSLGLAAFNRVANRLRDQFLFGVVVSEDSTATLQHFGAENREGGELIVFKAFDEGKEIFYLQEVGDSEEEKQTSLETTIEASVKQASVPLVAEIDQSNYRTYMESGTPLAYIFVDLTKAEERDTFVTPAVVEKARATKGRLNWVYIDFAKYGRHGERLGLSGKKSPAFAIEDLATGQHYAVSESEEFTVERFLDFADQFLAGTLAPTIKSEEIPQDNNGPVYVAVAKNFDELVLNNDLDVFVEFYAPWCGHCKNLAPIWEALAQFIRDKNLDSKVRIVKIDATANDINPSFGISGFPTLKLFVNGNKNSPIDYQGDRSKEDLFNFIAQNGANKFDADGIKDEL